MILLYQIKLNLTTSTFFYFDPVAQLVEHLPFKQRVLGSSPSRVILFNVNMYYLATPQAKTGIKTHEFDLDKLNRNDGLAENLEKSGIQIFLPQRDADQSLPGKELLEKELAAIRSSEGIIVVLSDTRGIYLEAGYAKALGRKVVGLKVPETREMSDWGYAFFDFVAQDEKELIDYLNRK